MEQIIEDGEPKMVIAVGGRTVLVNLGEAEAVVTKKSDVTKNQSYPIGYGLPISTTTQEIERSVGAIIKFYSD